MKSKLKRLLRLDQYIGDVVFPTVLGSFMAMLDDLDKLATILLANVLLAAFAFIFNDIEDSEEDSKSKVKARRNIFASGEMSKRQGYIVCILLAVSSLALYSTLGLTILLLGFVGFLAVFSYSYRGIRFKSTPLLDLLVHGFSHAMLFSIPIAVSSKFETSHVLMILIIFIISVLGNIRNQIRDYNLDRKTNIKNTAHYLDVRKFSSLLKVPTYFLLLILISLTLIKMTSLEIAISLLFIFVFGAIYYFQWGRYNNVPYSYPYKHHVAILASVLLIILTITK